MFDINNPVNQHVPLSCLNKTPVLCASISLYTYKFNSERLYDDSPSNNHKNITILFGNIITERKSKKA